MAHNEDGYHELVHSRLDTSEKYEKHLSDLSQKLNEGETCRTRAITTENGKVTYHCCYCGFMVKNFAKHWYKTNGHKRNETLKQLKDARDSLKKGTSDPLTAWGTILELLSKQTENGLLLSFTEKNWPNEFNVGPYRGKNVLDGSKQWCRQYLKDTEQLCVQTIQGAAAPPGAKGTVYFTRDELCMANNAEDPRSGHATPKPDTFPEGGELEGAAHDQRVNTTSSGGHAEGVAPLSAVLCKIIMGIHEIRQVVQDVQSPLIRMYPRAETTAARAARLCGRMRCTPGGVDPWPGRMVRHLFCWMRANPTPSIQIKICVQNCFRTLCAIHALPIVHA
jgi:hypothetical protein